MAGDILAILRLFIRTKPMPPIRTDDNECKPDFATGQIGALDRSLPATDRERLDRFVTDVREIERRIDQSARRVEGDIDLPRKPSGMASPCGSGLGDASGKYRRSRRTANSWNQPSGRSR